MNIKKININFMLLLHGILKQVYYFAALLVFIFIFIKDNFNFSPVSIISKFVYSIAFFLFLKTIFCLFYNSYKITTVNKLTHTISAKWFLEKDLKAVLIDFCEDLKRIVAINEELRTYTHDSYAKKLIEYLVGEESACKFREEKKLDKKLVQKKYIYEENGNRIILQKDKKKINRNIIGEFSFLNITDNDVKRYYEKKQFYKITIYIPNKKAIHIPDYSNRLKRND